MNNDNITIFGPAHSGKSTLCGYIKYRTSMSDDEFSDFIEDMKIQLGSHFKYGKIFSYLVDTHYDERVHKDAQEELKLGNTRYTKYLHINTTLLDNKDVTIIDTPGAQHNRKERLKGISFGDYGIFVVNVSQLIKLDSKSISSENIEDVLSIFYPLNVWLKVKDKNKLIVVLSKMDLVEFSQEKFNKAAEITKTITCESALKIIPSSVTVENRKGHNIFEKGNELAWYEGQSVLDVINGFTSRTDSPRLVEEPLFMYLERQFNKSGLGNVFRGKILHGKISTNSYVKISPLINNQKELIRVNAKIKNIRYDNVDVKNACKGDIVGIDLSDIKKEGKIGDIAAINNRKLKGRYTPKKYLRLVETSCVFDVNSHIIDGNILIFEVELNELQFISVGNQITVLWFGRTISCNVITKNILEDKVIVSVFLMKYLYVSLPVDEKKNLMFTKYLLETDQQCAKSSLKAIGFSESLSFNFTDLSSKIHKYSHILRALDYEIKGDMIKFRGHNLNPIISAIRKIIDAEHFSDNQYNVKIKLVTSSNLEC